MSLKKTYDNLVVAQFASPIYLGAGTGDDIYLLSNALLPSGTVINITDTEGNNSIQLVDGLAIASSIVADSAVQLTLNNGSQINIFGSDTFTYDIGGNITENKDFIDISYNDFVSTTLKTFVPSSGTNSGSPIIIGNTELTAINTTSKSDNILIPLYSSPKYIGSNEGNDTYILSQSLLTADVNITITDTTGVNSIQLVDGLHIASSKIANNALQLILDTGAVINILGANLFSYDIGGNLTTGNDEPDISFNRFVEDFLGANVPDNGIVEGGQVVIEKPSDLIQATIFIDATMSSYLADDNISETFIYSIDSSDHVIQSRENSNITIEGFNESQDKIIFQDVANSTVTTENLLSNMLIDNKYPDSSFIFEFPIINNEDIVISQENFILNLKGIDHINDLDITVELDDTIKTYFAVDGKPETFFYKIDSSDSIVQSRENNDVVIYGFNSDEDQIIFEDVVDSTVTETTFLDDVLVENNGVNSSFIFEFPIINSEELIISEEGYLLVLNGVNEIENISYSITNNI